MRQAKAFDVNVSAKDLNEFITDTSKVRFVYGITTMNYLLIVYYDDGKSQ